MAETFAPTASSRVLVTGAEGFVGSYMMRRLLEGAGPDAQILRAGRRPGLDVFMDLADRDSVAAAIAQARPDIVFHLAGEASVAAAAQAAANTWRVNLGGSLALAEALAATCPDATLLFASSSEVYGRAFLDGRVDEASRPAPTTVYAQSKFAVEQMLAAVLPATATLIVTRPSNHIGPGQNQRFAIPSFAKQLVAAETVDEPATIKVGNLATERDFMDVRDVVRAYVLLVDRFHRTGARETFNIASGTARSIRSLLDGLRADAHVESQVDVDPARQRPDEIATVSIDAAHVRNAIGWEPKVSIDASLRDVMAWARDA